MQRLGASARPKGKGWKMIVRCKSRKHVHFYWREARRSQFVPYIRKVGGLSAKIPYELWCKKIEGQEISDQELNGLIRKVAVQTP